MRYDTTPNNRLDRLIEFVNLTAKSGFVDIRPVIFEICKELELDPSIVLPSYIRPDICNPDSEIPF